MKLLTIYFTIFLFYSGPLMSYVGKVISNNSPMPNTHGSATLICPSHLTQLEPIFLTAAHFINEKSNLTINYKNYIYAMTLHLKDDSADFAILKQPKGASQKIPIDDCVNLKSNQLDLNFYGDVKDFESTKNIFDNTTNFFQTFINYFDIEQNKQTYGMSFLSLALYNTTSLRTDPILIAKINNAFEFPAKGMSGSSLINERLSEASEEKTLVGLVVAKHQIENYIVAIPSHTIIKRIEKFNNKPNSLINELKSLGWIPTGDPIDKK